MPPPLAPFGLQTLQEEQTVCEVEIALRILAPHFFPARFPVTL